MSKNCSIRNEKYINSELRQGSDCMQVNSGGWVGEREGIDFDSHVIQPGDFACVTELTYYHKDCWKTFKQDEERKHIGSLFERAGFRNVDLCAIRNEYCECELCPPWFNVGFMFRNKGNATHGQIKIGKRKRVYEINVEELFSVGLVKPLDLLLENEEVTKGTAYIHAWNDEKCVEYLAEILESVLFYSL
jgi:hypothetical protein